MRLRNIVIAVFTATTAAACATGGDTGQRYSSRSGNAAQARMQQSVASRYSDRTVAEAQRALGARGYAVGAVDGVWGPDSQSALQNFQRTRGLQATGRLDDRSLAALGVQRNADRQVAYNDARANNNADGSDTGASNGNASSRSSSVSSFDEGTIREVQRTLGDKGYDVGPVDGIWGPKSRSALRNFERHNGMQASGQLDPQVLAALDVNEPGAASSQSGPGPQQQSSRETQSNEAPNAGGRNAAGNATGNGAASEDAASAQAAGNGRTQGLEYSPDTRQAIHESQELNNPARQMDRGAS